LGVVIGGVASKHMLGVVVLPYSNWTWATVCESESMTALRKSLQRALFALGHVPKYLQTDNSTAATHKLGAKQAVSADGSHRRQFNEAYLALTRHYGLTPRTTAIGAKEQNGDVEAANGAVKRRLGQALLMRGDRNFIDVAAWQAFVDETLHKRNQDRQSRLRDEVSVMRVLRVTRLPEFVEEDVRVSTWGTFRVRQSAYSVPSRLRGVMLRVRVYEDRLEVFHGATLELACERQRNKAPRIDYRHVIWSLIRKPGAFARYVYREEMFPTPIFRRAYDALQLASRGTPGDLAYLRILHLAASTMQADVEAALMLLLEAGEVITADSVKGLVVSSASAQAREVASAASLTLPVPDLRDYDALLVGHSQEAA
jgi:hypothetical protein